MTDPAAVRLEGVAKHYGTTRAVAGVDLALAPGELFALLGPSGCGKTTLLRLVGGFVRPDAGRVHIGGADVTALPPQRRPTAMVFQSYALFPNLSVGENVAYGLRVRRMRRPERKAAVEAALARVDLAGYADRPVTALSGGQQQRVALARALAVAPAVVLYDEPLSNLDVALREQTRRELRALQQSLGTTGLYVTHDQQEALALADRIGVMQAGRLVQVGTPEALYEAPETAFVARFLGANVVEEAARVAVLAAARGEAVRPGWALALRPEHLAPDPEGPLTVRLRARSFLGLYAEWLLDWEGVPLRAWVEAAAPAADVVRLRPTALRWVRPDTLPLEPSPRLGIGSEPSRL